MDDELAAPILSLPFRLSNLLFVSVVNAQCTSCKIHTCWNYGWDHTHMQTLLGFWGPLG